jgi:hypothetical protein
MKKTLIARKPLIVITLDRGKDGLYTGEMAPFCAIDDTLFVRRVLCQVRQDRRTLQDLPHQGGLMYFWLKLNPMTRVIYKKERAVKSFQTAPVLVKEFMPFGYEEYKNNDLMCWKRYRRTQYRAL